MKISHPLVLCPLALVGVACLAWQPIVTHAAESVAENDLSLAKNATTESPVILTPPAPAVPRINGPSVFGVRPGAPFLYTIPVTGDRPMQFSVTNLPSGLSVDADSGRITGAITERGVYKVVMEARNSRGMARKPFQIVVGDKIALTPPMGWNSWNCWGGQVSQDQVLRSAKALVAAGLDRHGWTYVNIDDGWQGQRGGPSMSIQPNKKFPDMKALGDTIHAMGLKFGIYSTPWRGSYEGHIGSSCDRSDGIYGWIVSGDHNEFMRIGKTDAAFDQLAGGAQNEEKRNQSKEGQEVRAKRMSNWTHGTVPFFDQDAKQWADWGVDYLKYDWHPIDLPHTEAMSKALRSSGRDIVYSLSNEADIAHESDWARLANLWRTTGDINDTWKSMSGIGFDQQTKWSPCSGPGHYNDPDMLVVGWVGWGSPHPTKLTPNEQYTHISLWCMLSAPLLLGCDVEKLDPFTLGLLTNDEVLAIDQDSLAKSPRCITPPGPAKVYLKELADGTKAAGLFNLGDKPLTVSLDWKAAGLNTPQQLRDLWRQKDIGTYNGTYSAKIPSHGVLLLKVSP
jgi:alpha-galactosidase